MRNLDPYIFPGLLVIVGLALLINGVSGGQNMWFILGGLALLVTGAVAVLLQLGILNRTMGTVVGILFAVVSLGFAYRNYKTVEEDIKYTERKKVVNSHVIQGLKDIRTAQIGYRSTYGRYTSSSDSLLKFLKQGKLNVIKAVGQKPDSLSAEQAIALGIIRRDTLQINALDSLFHGEGVSDGRVFPFQLDSLVYAPFSNKKYILLANTINSSGRQVPVFLAKEPTPIEPPDTLMVGNLDKATTSGNWSGE